MTSRGGLRAVNDALDRAKPAPKLARGRREEEQRELPMLPAGCPVVPLGKIGQICWYLDELGQLIGLNPREHGKTHIQSLFGRQAHLVHEYWPRYGAVDKDTGERKITGWQPEVAAEQLQAACAHAGLFDPQGKVRGRGAHKGAGGELVLHCGDKVYRPDVMLGGGWADPGPIDGFVYPTAPAMPRPDPMPVTDEIGMMLLGLLRCWHWERPVIDPYLALGFIAHAPFGGACDWRSHLWVTGGSATGKSTLEKKLLAPMFDGLSLRTHQATEAALRQVLGNQTLPVFFDEIEAKANSDREQKVVELARLASSEGVIFRGGADHKATEFTARSSFYFSSILLPPMLSQDRNRMAILELREIPKGAREPMLERARILELGRQLRRRVIDQWPRLEATLAAYKAALGRAGHIGRGGDQFGTLLAFADLALYDGEPDGELLEEWAERLRAETLAETADNRADHEEACDFLGHHMLQLRGGDEPEPLTRLIARALGGHGADAIIVDRARQTLENHGMRLVTPTGADGATTGARDPMNGEPVYLAIINSPGHQALARIFRDERWAKGVWSQTFARVPGAIRRVQVRFAGKSSKATLVPIAALVDGEEGR